MKMAQRIVGKRDGKTYSVKVHWNGWFAEVDGIPTPMNEIPVDLREAVRTNVKEVCEQHGWEDTSDQ
jgi:hypothetical protein